MQHVVREISSMKAGAVIVAAGRGTRAATEIPKQFKEIAGAPVIAWSVRALAEAGVARIVAVVAEEHKDLLLAALKGGPVVQIAPGGPTRTASVRAGLTALAISNPEIALIHDAARPGLSPTLVRSLIEVIAAGADAVAPALPVADALKRAEAGVITGEAARDGLVRVQTPQAFRFRKIQDAYARTPVDAVFDDDLALARAAGIEGEFIPGDPRLMKLTYPEDFAMLDRVLGGARAACVGTGFDAHRFGPGDHVTLCGVRIPHHKGLLGHSDADAGWHALVDAILGALGQGDIGAHFPPSDDKWKGADSEVFLKHAAKLAVDAGARILHVDVTLICERPKVSPHRDAMRARTAEVLGLPLNRVSVKATTTEKLGFLGREEGLAAQAVASVERAL